MNVRHTPLSILLLPTALLSMLPGCYVDCPAGTTTATASYYQDPAYVTVQTAPPPVRPAVAVRPQQPQGAAWVDGHYSWRGTWVWIDGHWETPRAGFVWTAPAVVQAQGGYRYHPGYWRPGRIQAAPVYRQPSTVAVSVRPAASVAREGGSRVTVQGAGGAAPAGTVTVQGTQPGARSTVTVQGGARATTSAGTAAPTVRVQGGTRATVAPGTARPTVRVQGGTRTTIAPGTARPTVRVQGGTRTTTAPGTRGPRVQGPTSAGTGTRTTGATTVAVPTGRTTATVSAGTRTGPPGTATVNVGGARANATGTVALTCRVNSPRAPRGAYITVRGTGFGPSATVRIGGNIAAVSRTRDGQVRVQIPRDSNGGMVSIEDGGRRTNCGRLQIVGR